MVERARNLIRVHADFVHLEHKAGYIGIMRNQDIFPAAYIVHCRAADERGTRLMTLGASLVQALNLVIAEAHLDPVLALRTRPLAPLLGASFLYVVSHNFSLLPSTSKGILLWTGHIFPKSGIFSPFGKREESKQGLCPYTS